MSEKILKCDNCGVKFFPFALDPDDEWDFGGISTLEGVYTICKGCVYKTLYDHYYRKVMAMKGLAEKMSDL